MEIKNFEKRQEIDIKTKSNNEVDMSKLEDKIQIFGINVFDMSPKEKEEKISEIIIKLDKLGIPFAVNRVAKNVRNIYVGEINKEAALKCIE